MARWNESEWNADPWGVGAPDKDILKYLKKLWKDFKKWLKQLFK